MARKQPLQQPPASDDAAESQRNENKSPLSLDRLREAFAAMLNPHGAGSREQDANPTPCPLPTAPCPDPCEISPRSVVEAMLFVGRPDNRPLSAHEMAATMRGVSPSEIDAAVAELNQVYGDDRASYEIVGSSNGYQLALREEFGRMRDKLHHRVREAKLSSAALEVLSIVAYTQPTTVEEINELRGAASGAALSTLVRRKLVRRERPASASGPPLYWTTDRFLRLFGLESLAALPRSEELEKA